jgi:hypothetical protein
VPGPTTVVVTGSVEQLFLEPVDHFWHLTVESDFSSRVMVASLVELLDRYPDLGAPAASAPTASRLP